MELRNILTCEFCGTRAWFESLEVDAKDLAAMVCPACRRSSKHGDAIVWLHVDWNAKNDEVFHGGISVDAGGAFKPYRITGNCESEEEARGEWRRT